MPITDKTSFFYQLVKEAERQQRAEGNILNFEELLVFVSLHVLKQNFSRTWVDNVCLNLRGGSNYFRGRSNDSNDRVIATMRIVQVAECVFNFQDDPAFQHWITRAQRNSLETAVAELQALCLLREAGLSAVAKQVEGKLGEDYDFTVQSGAAVVACEVESKLEASRLTKNSIPDIIRRALDQLPDQAPGMIMLLLPLSWPHGPELVRAVETGAANAIQRRPSIWSVAAFSSILVPGSSGARFGYKLIREYTAPGRSNLFARLNPGKVLGENSEWLAFDQVALRVINERDRSDLAP